MSYNIFKHQVNYCLLNKEDNELDGLTKQRELKNFAPLTNMTNIKESNEKYFEMKEEYENKISSKLLAKLKDTEEMQMFPVRKVDNEINNSLKKKKGIKNSKSKDKNKKKL